MEPGHRPRGAGDCACRKAKMILAAAAEFRILLLASEALFVGGGDDVPVVMSRVFRALVRAERRSAARLRHCRATIRMRMAPGVG
jgi:hypothetical protein